MTSTMSRAEEPLYGTAAELPAECTIEAATAPLMEPMTVEFL